MVKYADDTYLIIPASGVHIRATEINNIIQVLKNDLTPTPAGIQLVCFDLLGCDVVYRFYVVYRPPTSTDGDGVKL